MSDEIYESLISLFHHQVKYGIYSHIRRDNLLSTYIAKHLAKSEICVTWSPRLLLLFVTQVIYFLIIVH